MPGSKEDMNRLTEGLPTKSAKIRALGAAGYKRQEIADFLGTSYQHVRNVLVAEEKKRAEVNARSGFAEDPRLYESRRVIAETTLRADGGVTLPPDAMDAAGFSPGDVVVIRVLGEGEIELLSSMAALRRAQEIVQRDLPPGVDLLEELFEMRRRDFEIEQRDFEEYSKK